MAIQEYFKEVLQQFRLTILVVMKLVAFANVLAVALSADTVCLHMLIYLQKCMSLPLLCEIP